VEVEKEAPVEVELRPLGGFPRFFPGLRLLHAVDKADPAEVHARAEGPARALENDDLHIVILLRLGNTRSPVTEELG
jgi:hypothetical protein